MKAKHARRIRSGILAAREGGMRAVGLIYGVGATDDLWLRAYSRTTKKPRRCPNCNRVIVRTSLQQHPDATARYRDHIKECWA